MARGPYQETWDGMRQGYPRPEKPMHPVTTRFPPSRRVAWRWACRRVASRPTEVEEVVVDSPPLDATKEADAALEPQAQACEYLCAARSASRLRA
jgi:hypothetical protein